MSSEFCDMGNKGAMLSTTTMLDTDEKIVEGFHPTDKELIQYLKRKLLGFCILEDKIPVVDIYKYEPWDLPHLSGLTSEWYFFCPSHYVNGRRSSRLTNEGFWKSTGKDRVIEDEAKRDLLFKKKSLVYYHKGLSVPRDRTNWVIHEIRETHDDGTTQGNFVLCKVVKKPDKNVKVSTNIECEPSCKMSPEHEPKGISEFSAPTCCKTNSDSPLSALSEEHRSSSSYGLAPTPESFVTPAFDELSSMVFGASVNQIRESFVTPASDELSTVVFGASSNPIPESFVTPAIEELAVTQSATNFEILYHGENNASHTTNLEQGMVEQQPAAPFIGYNEQCYGLMPTTVSFVTPAFGDLSPMIFGASGSPIPESFVTPAIEELVVTRSATDFEVTSYYGENNASHTNWVIHEIRATLDDGTTQGDYVLCKQFKKPDKNVKVSTDTAGEPSFRMSPEHDPKGNSEFSAPTSFKRNSDSPMSALSEEHSRCSSYKLADNEEDEPIPEIDFRTLYPSLHGEHIAAFTTFTEEVMVEQQPAVSFIGYNEQSYGLNPIPESVVTPKFGELSVSDYGIWN